MSERRPKSRGVKPAPAIRSPRFGGLVLVKSTTCLGSFKTAVNGIDIEVWRTSTGWRGEAWSAGAQVWTPSAYQTAHLAARALRLQLRRTIKTFTALLKGAK